MLAGSPEVVAARIDEYASAGATDLMLGFTDFPSTRMLRAFAAEVRPRLTLGADQPLGEQPDPVRHRLRRLVGERLARGQHEPRERIGVEPGRTTPAAWPRVNTSPRLRRSCSRAHAVASARAASRRVALRP